MTFTLVVGVAAVWVATTTLCVAGAGTTVSVLVELGPATSDCAVCSEQKEMKGWNSGDT